MFGTEHGEKRYQTITISIRESNPPQHLALLIYPRRLCYTDLYGGKGRLSVNNAEAESSVSGAAQTVQVIGRAKALWSVDLSMITSVRASTHGIAIQ